MVLPESGGALGGRDTKCHRYRHHRRGHLHHMASVANAMIVMIVTMN